MKTDKDLMALAKLARFEEGVSADPTKNMSEEDAKKWKEMNDLHGDKFKTAAWPFDAEMAVLEKWAAGRSLSEIAREIRKDWHPANYAAEPYLQAMMNLDDINDNYGLDSAKSVVAYFLSNATTWRGEKAKTIKAELNAMLKGGRRSSEDPLLEMLASDEDEFDTPIVAEGCPDNLDESECHEWEANTDKYHDVVKDQHTAELADTPGNELKKSPMDPLANFNDHEVDFDDPRDEEGEGSMIPGLEDRLAAIALEANAENDMDPVAELEGMLAEGCPDNLSGPDCDKWESNTDKYQNVVKDQHQAAEDKTAYVSVVQYRDVLREAVNRKLVSKGEADLPKVIRAAGEAAERINASWPMNKKDGFGSSDMDDLMVDFLNDAGIRVVNRGGRVIRLATAKEADSDTLFYGEKIKGNEVSWLFLTAFGVAQEDVGAFMNALETALHATTRGQIRVRLHRVEDDGVLVVYWNYNSEQIGTYEASDMLAEAYLMAAKKVGFNHIKQLGHAADVQRFVKQAADDVDEKAGKFEEGVSADPTKDMSPEDAAEWKKQNDEHKDNFKNAGLNGYIAFFRGKKIEVEAKSSYEAQQIAAKKFGARRESDVTVMLAEKDGQSVKHDPMFASSDKNAGGEVEVPVLSGGRPGEYVVGSGTRANGKNLSQVVVGSLTQTLDDMWGEFEWKGKKEAHVVPPPQQVLGDLQAEIGLNHRKVSLFYHTDTNRYRVGPATGRMGSERRIRTTWTDKTAAEPTGLYGHTRAVQSTCENSIKRLQKTAKALAKQIYAKNEDTAPFLAAHAKRANSLPAKILVEAMKDIGPKIASTMRLAELRIEASPPEKVTKEAARKYGLYGFPAKTAKLGLGACTSIREQAGTMVADMHGRKADAHGNITGFFNSHAKEAKCMYAKMLASAYPDPDRKTAAVVASEPKSVKEWLAWDE